MDMNFTPACYNCKKRIYCSNIKAETGCCSEWQLGISENRYKTYSDSKEDIPIRTYPDIFELEDRIKVLEEKIKKMESDK